MTLFPRSFTLLPILALLVGCSTIDNSGGPPPAGDSIEYTQLALQDVNFMCGSFTDAAALLTDEADVDEWLAGCFEEDPSEMRGALLAEIADLADDESLIVADVVLGGCVEDFEVMDVALDDDVVRPWILKEDISYGRTDIACAAIIGEALLLLRVADERASTAAELHVGTYNPELPGGPVSIQ